MMNFRQGSKEFIPIFQVDSAVFHLCKKALNCFMKISIMCRTEGVCIKHDRNLRHLVKLMPGFQARKISSFMSKGGGVYPRVSTTIMLDVGPLKQRFQKKAERETLYESYS